MALLPTYSFSSSILCLEMLKNVLLQVKKTHPHLQTGSVPGTVKVPSAALQVISRTPPSGSMTWLLLSHLKAALSPTGVGREEIGAKPLSEGKEAQWVNTQLSQPMEAPYVGSLVGHSSMNLPFTILRGFFEKNFLKKLYNVGIEINYHLGSLPCSCAPGRHSYSAKSNSLTEPEVEFCRLVLASGTGGVGHTVATRQFGTPRKGWSKGIFKGKVDYLSR